jgi:hypothetical protein
MSMLVYDDQCWNLAAEWHAINTAPLKLAPNPQMAALDSLTVVQPS